MGVNLVKGQKVDLRKPDGNTLKHVVVGLGWDEAPQPKRGLFASKPQPIDCDASAILCTNGKLASKADVIYFGNLRHRSGCVQHMGDNLTGAGDGDDEQIKIDLANLPDYIDKIVITIHIYKATMRNQHFGMIQNAFCHVIDSDNSQDICRYNLTDDYSDSTALLVAEIYRHNDTWKINALGQGTSDTSLAETLKRYI